MEKFLSVSKPDMSSESLNYLFARVIYDGVKGGDKSRSTVKELKELKIEYTHGKEGKTSYHYDLTEIQIKSFLEYLVSRKFLSKKQVQRLNDVYEDEKDEREKINEEEE